jgi:hypothetical protein
MSDWCRRWPVLCGVLTMSGVVLGGLFATPIVFRVLSWWWCVWLPCQGYAP